MNYYNTDSALQPKHPSFTTSAFKSELFGTVQHPSNILKELLSLWPTTHKVKAMILTWLDGWLKGGKEWVYATSRALSDEFGYDHKTFWKHLKELVEDGILERRKALRWPTDQAFAYRINFERLLEVYYLSAVESLLKPRNALTLRLLSQNWNIEIGITEHGDCTNWNIDVPKTEQSHNSSLIHTKSPQHHVWEKNLSFKEEEIDQQNCPAGLAPQDPGFNSEEINEKKSSLPPPEIEISSAAVEEKINKMVPLVPVPSGQGFGKQKQPAINMDAAAKAIAKVNESIDEPLKPIRFNAVCGTIAKYPQNFAGALAAVQQGLEDGWMKNPTGYLIKALQEGINPEPTPDSKSVSIMGRNQWWKWLGQQWGTDKRNRLIQRISDIGEGLRVYFASGFSYPFEIIRDMDLEIIEGMALQMPDLST